MVSIIPQYNLTDTNLLPPLPYETSADEDVIASRQVFFIIGSVDGVLICYNI